MKLKTLLKYYNKSSYIVVFDSQTSVTSRYMTVPEFKKEYGKEVLKRNIICIDVTEKSPYTIIIDI